jgi:hypothetical protein
MLYLRILHLENIAKNSIQKTAISPGGTHPAFSDNHIAFFRHASHFDCWASDESVILNLFVEGYLPCQVKYARYHPFDIICQTRQDFRMIRLGESIHVPLHGLLVSTHGFVLAGLGGG